MEAVGRKSSRKGGGKVESGSKKKQHQAISRRENRKRLFEERRKEKDDQAKLEQVGEQAWSHSLEKMKSLADGGPEKKTSERRGPVISVFGDDLPDILDMTGTDDVWAAWQAAMDESPIIPEAQKKESMEELEMRMEAKLRDQEDLSDEDEDYEARRARNFRDDWECLWSGLYGAFEDNTRIPRMRFTFRTAPWDAGHQNALQFFSAKVTSTRGVLPFDVFGMVAIRDTIDHNRNIVFCRTRDNCQTLTKENPYLVLTGPTRAVMLEPLGPSSPVIIEVDLTLKGTTDSGDEKLSSLAVPVLSSDTMYSHMWKRAYTSQLSTVEFTLGHIISSVEATIFVQITRGSWPDGFRAQISAVAAGVRAKAPGTVYHSVNDVDFVLLESGGGKVPVTGDGDIKLSRHVVSVDTTGQLKVSVKAWGDDNSFMEKWVTFKPLDAGKRKDTIDIGSCAMDVTVFWSLISSRPFYAKSAL